MSTITRNDVHRPSVIEPADYTFIGMLHSKDEPWQIVAMERKRIFAHIAMTGGKYSSHDHGGTCHICGANAVYLAVYYHGPSNEYIKVGEDCAAKIDCEATESFRAIRAEAESARYAKAGKMKARQMMIDLGMERAWILADAINSDEGLDELTRIGAYSTMKIDGMIYQCKRCGDNNYEYWIAPKLHVLMSVMSKVVKYGNITDKQIEFVRTLAYAIDNAEAYRREREEKKAKEREGTRCMPRLPYRTSRDHWHCRVTQDDRFTVRNHVQNACP